MRKILLQFYLLATLLLLADHLFSQSAPDSLRSVLTDRLTQQLELIAENTEEAFDFTDLTESYFFLVDQPVNINDPLALDQLLEIYLITPFQYEQLKNYLQNFGPLLSKYELAAIDGFDDETIALLEPVITLETSDSGQNRIKLKNVFKYARHQFLARTEMVLEQREGYKPISDSALWAKPNSRYLGSPEKYYVRYNFNYRNQFRAGVTMEKDAGEVFFKENVNDSIQKLLGDKLKSGFDFYSVHAYAADLGILRAVALGDYHLAFGQGLTMWSGLSFGKSTEASSVMRYGSGLKPNTSVNENFFLRGAAATFGYKGIELTGFYSLKNIDANIDQFDSISGEIAVVTSLQESGLHRTVNELLDKNAIQQQLIGGRLSYKGRFFDVGATVHQTSLEADLVPRIYPYNQFQLIEGDLMNYGFDFRLTLPQIVFFGEIAGSDNGGMAGIAGFTAQPVGFLTTTIAYRNYQKSYQNYFSNAFAESSNTNNETGIYFGLNAAIAPRWQLRAFADHFQFPWLRFRTDAPSYGHDYFVQLDHEINRNANFYIRFRTKKKLINSDDPWNRIDYVVPYHKDSYRFHINYSIGNSFTLKNRAEWIVYKHQEKPQSNGFLIYQDILFRPPSDKVQLTLRYAIFDADTYDSRIYAYENDVLYAFSIPAFYEKGSRVYFLVKYSLTKSMDLWARIGQTWYSTRSEIGTGLELIEGNKRTDLKIQLRVKL